MAWISVSFERDPAPGKHAARGPGRHCRVCGRPVKSRIGQVCSRARCHRTSARLHQD